MCVETVTVVWTYEGSFGTEILWPQEQLAAMPHVTEDNKVIDDITEWKEQLVIPDIVGQCSDPALWEPFKQKAQEIKDSGSLFMHLCLQVFLRGFTS